MRRRSRAATALSCTALVVGASLASAPSAVAASATATCTAPVNNYVYLAPGETFTLSVTGSCTMISPAEGNIGSVTYGATGTEAELPQYTWTNVIPPVVAIYHQPACSDPQALLDAIYTYNAGATNLGTYAVDFAPNPCITPPDVLQQVTPGSDGACAGITAPQFDIGGAESGGWGRSWAQWVNGGTGGAVCTRTLTYDDSAGHWTVAPPQGD